MVGANPPPYVLEAFLRKIWRNYEIDKVVLMKKGVSIVRLKSMEKRDAILAGNGVFFDNKPLIGRAWERNMDIAKEQFDVLPTWIQLYVHFKYWGKTV